MNFDILTIYLISIPAILAAVTINEFTKALTSTILGDPSPKAERRLTLNPFNHFEPIGFIFMLFLGFGWGKPVGTSSVYYKNRTMGTVITYTAPIFTNLLFSFIFAILNGFIVTYLNDIVSYDVLFYVKRFFSVFIQYNISLAIFNIIPVTPLCGSRIMKAFMSPNSALKISHYEKIFQIILIMLMLFGIVGNIINPIVEAVIWLYNNLIIILF